jgi:hypothetical protein
MIKNQKLFHSQIRKPYWGVLARDSGLQTIHKPENFMSLLQAQSQNTEAEAVPFSALGGAIPVLARRVTGKQKSKRLSKDLPL